jgi:hypothetical protein
MRTVADEKKVHENGINRLISQTSDGEVGMKRQRMLSVSSDGKASLVNLEEVDNSAIFTEIFVISKHISLLFFQPRCALLSKTCYKCEFYGMPNCVKGESIG